MLDKLKGKRAITLVETVVAIAIIAIVSVLTVSISVYSIKTEERNYREIKVSQVANAVVEIFEFSADLDEFNQVIEESGVKLEGKDYIVSVEFDQEFKEVEITAKTTNGEQIYYLTYQRRV